MTKKLVTSLQRRTVFPFAAIIGQEQMKLSLLLNVINPAIGGVLIRGEKGTAKSTAVRGLAALLPSIPIISDCGYNCSPEDTILCPVCQASNKAHCYESVKTIPTPVVDLPLGATEDMVLGSIDFEAALKHGTSRFMPGLLAKAHHGILYIDEVNLLDDHLVDSVIDASESGINLVEREGMSIWHPSRFILVGTMNPEEGELRPQLLDRFGLAVEVQGEHDPATRVELMRRREQFDLDSQGIESQYKETTYLLSSQIKEAQKLLPYIFIARHIRAFIAEICNHNNVAGHRADLAIERAASAHAALKGRTEVKIEDVTEVASMALLHRIRNAQQPEMPPPPPPSHQEKEHTQEQEQQEDSKSAEQDLISESKAQSSSSEQRGHNNSIKSADSNSEPHEEPDDENPREEIQEIGIPFRPRTFVTNKDRVLRIGSGRRSRTMTANKQGRYVKSSSRNYHNDLALDATIRAASPYQFKRKEKAVKKLAIHIKTQDIREKIRERRVGNILLFVVDASGSMGAQKRMVETKAAIMSLLLDAYQKRDRVGLIVFRGRTSEVLLPPTTSVEMAGRLLASLPVGGRTPLSEGLSKTAEILGRIRRKDSAARPVVILLTDGKANVGIGDKPPHLEALAIASKLGEHYEESRFIVVDTEPPGIVRFELAKKLASALQADYLHPHELCAEELVKIAKER